MSQSEIHWFPIFSYVQVRDPPPPSLSSSIHPHYLTPMHFFIHSFGIIMYPLIHPFIRHHYVPTSSSIHPASLCTHFFIHPFFHPSIHQHKVPNLLPCTSSSIHPSSLCTHFFISSRFQPPRLYDEARRSGRSSLG